MKKHKILIVALALAVMLTGAGYAYWTQSLTINNTVSTGNLDVSFITPTVVGDWDNEGCSNRVTTGAIIVNDGKSINFTIDNFYPGAGASLDFVIQNTGSVAAEITGVTATSNWNPDLCNALEYEFTQVERNGMFYNLNEHVKAHNLTDLASGLTRALKGIEIQPGEIVKLRTAHNSANPGYNIMMPSTEEGFEQTSASFTLNLTFQQID